MHDMATPEEAAEQFRARFGRKPSYYALYFGFNAVCASMDWINAAATIRHDLIELGKPEDEEQRLTRSEMLTSVDWAALCLNPDSYSQLALERMRENYGFIHGPIIGIKGENFTRLVRGFVELDYEPIKREFNTVVELLSNVSGKDIRWLGQYYIVESYYGLRRRAAEAWWNYNSNFSQAQLDFLAHGHIVPHEHIPYIGPGL